MSDFSAKCSPLLLALVFAGAAQGQTLESQNGRDSDVPQHYLRAQAAQQKGDLAAAAGEYRAFLSGALIDLGDAYTQARDYSQAMHLFGEARTLDPASPQILLADARVALLGGDLQRAKSLASDLLGLAPTDRDMQAEAHQLIGRTFLQLQQDDQARKEFETAVALNPTFANGYDLAVACLDLADEPCALHVFKEMEDAFGDTPDVHMAFGRAYADSDFQPRAVTEFERVIKEDPRRPGAHYLLAALLLASGGGDTSTQAAEAALTAELTISPHDSMTYAALGQIALIRNDYPNAIDLLKKAIQYGPEFPEGYLYLGQAYYDTGKFPEAEAAFRSCIRLTTDPSRNRYQVQKAHYLLGRILMKQGQVDPGHAELAIARDLADKTLAGDKRRLTGLMESTQAPATQDAAVADASAPAAPTVKDPALLKKADTLQKDLRSAVAVSYDSLGIIAATHAEYLAAIQDFRQASTWDGTLDGLDFNWGRAAFAGKQYAEANAPLSRYVSSHPDDTGAQSVLGLSEFLSLNYAACVQTLQSLASKVELDPQVEYAFAESLVQTGKVDAGAERLSALSKAHPEIAEVHRALGEALRRLGRREDAIAQLKDAVASAPEDAVGHFDLGELDLETGQVHEAVGELEIATRLRPQEPAWHKELAAAYTAAHRTAEAEQQLQSARAVSPATNK